MNPLLFRFRQVLVGRMFRHVKKITILGIIFLWIFYAILLLTRDMFAIDIINDESNKNIRNTDTDNSADVFDSQQVELSKSWNMNSSLCKDFVQNVYYAKIHKTGSSSMITLFYSFVRRHNLSIFPHEFDSFPQDMSTKIMQVSFMGFLYSFGS